MQSVHVLYMTYVGFYLEVQTDVDSQDDKPSESNPRWVPMIFFGGRFRMGHFGNIVYIVGDRVTGGCNILHQDLEVTVGC